MDNERLKELAENPDVVGNIIWYIRASYDEIIEYLASNEKKDIDSYYMFGHCPAFFLILYNIFLENAKLYVSKTKGHVITKLGIYYYDVRGFIPAYQEDFSEYIEYSIEEYQYIEQEFLNEHDRNVSDKLVELLSKIGKDKLIEYEHNIFGEPRSIN